MSVAHLGSPWVMSNPRIPDHPEATWMKSWLPYVAMVQYGGFDPISGVPVGSEICVDHPRLVVPQSDELV